jgi:hypothetical protein
MCSVSGILSSNTVILLHKQKNTVESFLIIKGTVSFPGYVKPLDGI